MQGKLLIFLLNKIMKGFFKNFQNALYNVDVPDFKGNTVITDITRTILFQDISDYNRYEKYYITDGETPDSVAYKLYGDSTKHWMLYLLNPELENAWPLSDSEIEKTVERKYGNFSFLALADEEVYNLELDKIIVDTIQFDAGFNVDVTTEFFDFNRRGFVISKLVDELGQPRDTWMSELSEIVITFNTPQYSYSTTLNVNPDNCRYNLKDAVYQYEYKSYRDALINGDDASSGISFEQYEINRNENKRLIRVFNSADAERVAAQYFALLNNG